MRSPTWETRPELALAAIDRMRLAPDAASAVTPTSGAAAEREGARRPRSLDRASRPTRRRRAQFAAALRAATVWLAGAGADEDQQHPPDPRVPHGACASSAGAWSTRARSTRSEDFGFLRQAELRRPSSPIRTRFTDEIRRRRTPLRASCRTSSRRSCSWATRLIPSTWARRDAADVAGLASGRDAARACPAAPGVAEGRARVVLDSNDPTALEPGDVLVAPITDPSWTPLFVPAAAVVVDVGAPLSHADHRQPRARHPVRRLRHRRHAAHPRRRDGPRRRRRPEPSRCSERRSMQRWITDTVPSDRFPIYTRANAGEVLPDPVLPLSSTWVARWATGGWLRHVREARHVRPGRVGPDRPEIVGFFGGYLYINMSMTRHLRRARARPDAGDGRLPVLRRDARHHAVRGRGPTGRRERSAHGRSSSATSTDSSPATTCPSCERPRPGRAPGRAAARPRRARRPGDRRPRPQLPAAVPAAVLPPHPRVGQRPASASARSRVCRAPSGSPS